MAALLRRCRARDERGSIVATVPLIGATFLLFLLVVQISLWFFGRMVIAGAAQHGLDAARLEGAELSSGEQVVDEFISQTWGVDSYQREVTEDGGRVEVVVRAQPLRVVEVFPLPSMTVAASGPREQVVD